MVVSADIFTDGHDMLAAALLYRRAGESRLARGADGSRSGTTAGRPAFPVDAIGRYEYTVEGWIDRFGTWRHELSKKFGAGQDVASELLEGAALVRETIGTGRRCGRREAPGADRRGARRRDRPAAERVAQALADALAETMAAHADRERGDPLRPRASR